MCVRRATSPVVWRHDDCQPHRSGHCGSSGACARTHTRRKVGFKTRRDFLPITSPITQNGFIFFIYFFFILFLCGVPVRWSTVRLTPLIPVRPHRPDETFTGAGGAGHERDRLIRAGCGLRPPKYWWSWRRRCLVWTAHDARTVFPFRHHWMSGQCAHGACEIRGVCHQDLPFKVYMMCARIIKVNKYFQSVLKRQRLKQRIHFVVSMSCHHHLRSPPPLPLVVTLQLSVLL